MINDTMRQMVALKRDSKTTARERKNDSRTNDEDPGETVVLTYHRAQSILQEEWNTRDERDKVLSAELGEVDMESIQYHGMANIVSM